MVNVTLFRNLIGSSIARKREIILRITESYDPKIKAARRRGQLLGAATKRKRTDEMTLPAVLLGIRKLIDSGAHPTQHACRSDWFQFDSTLLLTSRLSEGG
jgi:hypothetical protein